jgi:hypothetical protein
LIDYGKRNSRNDARAGFALPVHCGCFDFIFSMYGIDQDLKIEADEAFEKRSLPL